MKKDEMFNEILRKEGGYSNHPDDKGEETRWGITEKVARAHGYSGDMRKLPKNTATAILEADYWKAPRFDEVANFSTDIAMELCDTGINMGPSVATKMLQRWLNVFNQQGKLYPDMTIDGQIGPRTLTALRIFLMKRGIEGECVLLKSLNCTQGARYLELAEHHATNEEFIYGWVKERVTFH